MGTRPFLLLSRCSDAACLWNRGSRGAAQRRRRRGILGRRLHRYVVNRESCDSRISTLELHVLRNRSVNFFENIAHSVSEFPVWIMRLELSYVADPPDVVADAIPFLVAPV